MTIAGLSDRAVHFNNMPLYKGFIAFIFLVMSATSAFAQGSAGTASASNGRMELFLSSGFLALSKNSSQLDVSPGLQYQIFGGLPWFELGAEADFQRLSLRNETVKSLLVLAGPTFNLGGTMVRDSVFFSIGFAYRSGEGDHSDPAVESPNGNGYYFLVGKRFPMFGNWTFRPSIGMVSVGTDGIIFRPLAFSYHF